MVSSRSSPGRHRGRDRTPSVRLHPKRHGWLFAVTPIVSNLVSNVPAVMLLLPASSGPQTGAVLALASTFAGNLLIVGSIANIIVVEQAGKEGIVIDWRSHARTGVPVTLATLAIAAACCGCGRPERLPSRRPDPNRWRATRRWRATLPQARVIVPERFELLRWKLDYGDRETFSTPTRERASCRNGIVGTTIACRCRTRGRVRPPPQVTGR